MAIIKGTVVYFAYNATGHMKPFMSTLKELKARGYRVVVLTIFPYGRSSDLLSVGLEVEFVRESSKKVSERFASLVKVASEGPLASYEAVCLHTAPMILKPVVENYSSIEAKLAAIKPDLVIVDHPMLTPPCIMHLPWVQTFAPFPTALYALYNRQLVPWLGLGQHDMTEEARGRVDGLDAKVKLVRQFYKEQGVKLDEKVARNWHIAPLSPHLNLYLGPRELGYEREPGIMAPPHPWFRLEHNLEPLDAEFEMPECLAGLPGKLIYFSMGTLASVDAELLNRLLAMLGKSRNRFIVSMGSSHERVKLQANMWGAAFLDQRAVLEKVDLFITHGGHNSTIEAFYHGVPGLLVLPAFGDQFDTAQRVQECGFGLRLDPFKCTGQELLGAIDRLLTDDQLGIRMKAISERLKSIRYHEIAADKIEELLRSSRRASAV